MIEGGLKQKAALKEITEDHRSVSGATRAVGYSNSTATKPSNLTTSKGFRELLQQHLPDDLLLKVHEEGLAATKLSNSLTAPDIEVPDYPTRHRYLDTAYKIKGHAAPDTGGNKILIINISGQSAGRYGANPSTNTDSD